MPAHSSPDPQALLAHVEWVRELARHLVSDFHAAEDLAQETLTAAIERGPRDDRPPRRWLVAVLRNFIRQGSRSAARRRERERAAARSGEQPPTHAVVERAAAHREVVDAVMGLEEPYRTVVLLRFYDGLPPRAIAAQLGLPVATVRTRIARGLERLRRALDDGRAGDRHSWAFTLLALADWPPAGWSVAAGTSIMNAKAAVAAGLLGLALVAGGAWWLAAGGGGTGAEGTGRNAVAAAPKNPSAAAAPPSAGRNDSRAPAAPSSRSTDPVGILVYGTVTDPRGNLLKAGLTFTNERDETFYAASRGDDGAGFSTVEGRPGRWLLECHADGYARIEREIEIEAGIARKRIDLVLEPTGILRIHWVTPEGKPLIGRYDTEEFRKLQKLGLSIGDERTLLAMATRNPPPARFAAMDNPTDLLALGSFTTWTVKDGGMVELPQGVDGLLRLTAPPPLYVSAVLRNVVLSTTRVEPGTEDVALVVDPRAVLGALATVTARVVDGETGAPMPNVRVGIDNWHTGGSGRATDADGRVTLDHQEPGGGELRVWPPKGYAFFGRSVKLEPGQTLEVGTLVMRKAVEIRGNVVDEAGAPVAVDLTVRRLDPEAGPLAPRAETMRVDSDGAFAAPVAPGRYLLTLNHKSWSVRPLVADASLGPVKDLRVTVRRDGVPVRIRVADGDPEYLALTITNDLDQVVWSALAITKKRHSLLLAPGSYTLTMRDETRTRRAIPFEAAREPVLLELAR